MPVWEDVPVPEGVLDGVRVPDGVLEGVIDLLDVIDAVLEVDAVREGVPDGVPEGERDAVSVVEGVAEGDVPDVDVVVGVGDTVLLAVLDGVRVPDGVLEGVIDLLDVIDVVLEVDAVREGVPDLVPEGERDAVSVVEGVAEGDVPDVDVVVGLKDAVLLGVFNVGIVTGKREFRVHTFNGNFYVTEKKRMAVERRPENFNKYIRNHSNGWVFCREMEPVPEEVLSQAEEAVNALNLVFGAVDVGWHPEHGVCVYEVNTAPGCDNETALWYATNFVRYSNEN